MFSTRLEFCALSLTPLSGLLAASHCVDGRGGEQTVSDASKTMLKKVLFAVVATGFVAALALPVQFTAAEADVQGCRQDGFPKRQEVQARLQEGVQGRLESLAQLETP